MKEDIKQHEVEVRKLMRELADYYKVRRWPAFEHEFRFVQERVNQLQYHLNMRNGLKRIHEEESWKRN